VRRRMPFLGARSSLHRWLDERPGTRERVIDS
jgi:hypothetical protein